jgi:endonuclease G, mitochondrial
MSKRSNISKGAGLFVALFSLAVGVGWSLFDAHRTDDNDSTEQVSASVQQSSEDLSEENSIVQQDVPVASSTDDASTTEVAENIDAAYEEPVMQSKNVPSQILRRMAYTTSYNSKTRNPNWVGWVLTSEHADGEVGRSGQLFIEDEDVPEPRATYRDIREGECGYQRGHMCPAADNKWSYKAMKEAFLMTNICPQNGNLNQNDWESLEGACREWARKYGKIYIVAGPVFNSKKYKTVGEHEVAVPDAFFKVVLTFGSGNPKAIGFLYDNQSGHHKMEYYACTVDEVEKVTGMDFFSQLSDDVEVAIESKCNLDEW